MTDRRFFLHRAKIFLEAARSLKGDRVLVHHVRLFLKQARASEKKIGTSKDELVRLQTSPFDQQKICARAQQLLVTVRSGDEDAGRSVVLLRMHLTRHGLTHAMFGTSEQELEGILHHNHLQDALEQLRDIRDQTVGLSGIKELRRMMYVRGLTLEEIGTTSDELGRLTRGAVIFDAIRALERGEYHELFRLVKRYGLQVQELGLSQPEYDHILQTHHLQEAHDWLGKVRTENPNLSRHVIRHLKDAGVEVNVDHRKDWFTQVEETIRLAREVHKVAET